MAVTNANSLYAQLRPERQARQPARASAPRRQRPQWAQNVSSYLQRHLGQGLRRQFGPVTKPGVGMDRFLTPPAVQNPSQQMLPSGSIGPPPFVVQQPHTPGDVSVQQGPHTGGATIQQASSGMQPLYGPKGREFDPMQDMGADFRVRPPGGSPQYQTQQAAQAVQSRLGQPDPAIQRQQMRELGRQSIPAPLTPRVDAVTRLGNQNMAGIQGSPLMQQFGIADAPDLGEMPAADRFRQMQQVDPAGPYSGMSGGYSQNRLLNTGNTLGLARTPDVPGEGAGQSIAYNPGAAGSSPFVSDGPLSGGPRGSELQGRLDAMRQGLSTGAGRRVGQLGTLAQPTEDGGVRLLGPVAQRTLERLAQEGRPMTASALAAQRDNIIGGAPTTIGEDGSVQALHPEQQRSMDLRLNRFRQLQSADRGIPFDPDRSVPEMAEIQRGVTPLQQTLAGGPGGAGGPTTPRDQLRNDMLNSEIPDTGQAQTIPEAEGLAGEAATKLLQQVLAGDRSFEQAMAEAQRRDQEDPLPAGVPTLSERLQQMFEEHQAEQARRNRMVDERIDQRRQFTIPAPLGF